MDWTDLIVKIGFPAAALAILAHWVAKRIEKTEDNSMIREEAMRKEAMDRERVMGNRIDDLNTKIEVELAVLIRDQGKVIVGAEKTIEHAEKTIEACTNILGKLDSTIVKRTVQQDRETERGKGKGQGKGGSGILD